MFSCSDGVLEHLEERSCQWDVPGLWTIPCLVLLPGCDQGATIFLPRIQCLQFKVTPLSLHLSCFNFVFLLQICLQPQDDMNDG